MESRPLPRPYRSRGERNANWSQTQAGRPSAGCILIPSSPKATSSGESSGRKPVGHRGTASRSDCWCCTSSIWHGNPPSQTSSRAGSSASHTAASGASPPAWRPSPAGHREIRRDQTSTSTRTTSGVSHRPPATPDQLARPHRTGRARRKQPTRPMRSGATQRRVAVSERSATPAHALGLTARLLPPMLPRTPSYPRRRTSSRTTARQTPRRRAPDRERCAQIPGPQLERAKIHVSPRHSPPRTRRRQLPRSPVRGADKYALWTDPPAPAGGRHHWVSIVPCLCRPGPQT